MKIRMTKTAQGPTGCWLAGEEYDVSPELAKGFVADRAAVPASVEETETASAFPVTPIPPDPAAEDAAKKAAADEAAKKAAEDAAKKAADDEAAKKRKGKNSDSDGGK